MGVGLYFFFYKLLIMKNKLIKMFNIKYEINFKLIWNIYMYVIIFYRLFVQCYLNLIFYNYLKVVFFKNLNYVFNDL